MKNKLDKILDAIYGNKIKNRWVKLLGSIAFLFFLIGFTLWIIFNVNYDKKYGFYIKAPETKINIEVKKEVK